jgi:hypothetical protein
MIYQRISTFSGKIFSLFEILSNLSKFSLLPHSWIKIKYIYSTGSSKCCSLKDSSLSFDQRMHETSIFGIKLSTNHLNSHDSFYMSTKLAKYQISFENFSNQSKMNLFTRMKWMPQGVFKEYFRIWF